MSKHKVIGVLLVSSVVSSLPALFFVFTEWRDPISVIVIVWAMGFLFIYTNGFGACINKRNAHENDMTDYPKDFGKLFYNLLVGEKETMAQNAHDLARPLPRICILIFLPLFAAFGPGFLISLVLLFRYFIFFE